MKYNWEKGDERIHSIKDLVSKNLGVPDADKEIRRWKEKYETG